MISIYDTKPESEITLTNNLDMSLPPAEYKRSSVWVNSQIWEEFGPLCKVYKDYTKKELLSKALNEFIDKYK